MTRVLRAAVGVLVLVAMVAVTAVAVVVTVTLVLIARVFPPGSVSEARSMWSDEERDDRPIKPSNDQAELTEDDVDGFMESADVRRRGNNKEAEEFLDQLRARHPLRAKRITDDVDWLREKADEYGVPDSVLRWLL